MVTWRAGEVLAGTKNCS